MHRVRRWGSVSQGSFDFRFALITWVCPSTLPSDRWSSSRIFRPLTQSLQSREETRRVVLPNRPRSSIPSGARILNGQFPYRHRRRLACEKERGARRCQINTGGEISTSCTPVAGQAKERELHRRLPKGSLAKKRGAWSNPPTRKDELLPFRPSTLAKESQWASKYSRFQLHTITVHFVWDLGTWVLVALHFSMKNFVFQAILPYNQRAHSPPHVLPSLALHPPSPPPPSTQMSPPPAPPWRPGLAPGTASAPRMTLRSSGMDVELRLCRVTEIWDRLMAAEQAQFQQRGCTWAQQRWWLKDVWKNETCCYFQSPHNGRKTTNLDTQLAFLRKEMVRDLYCMLSNFLCGLFVFFTSTLFRWASDR